MAHETTEADLRAAFSSFGEVLSAKVMSDRRGRTKQFAYVEMEDENSARLAMEGLRGEASQRAHHGYRLRNTGKGTGRPRPCWPAALVSAHFDSQTALGSVACETIRLGILSEDRLNALRLANNTMRGLGGLFPGWQDRTAAPRISRPQPLVSPSNRSSVGGPALRALTARLDTLRPVILRIHQPVRDLVLTAGCRKPVDTAAVRVHYVDIPIPIVV